MLLTAWCSLPVRLAHVRPEAGPLPSLQMALLLGHTMGSCWPLLGNNMIFKSPIILSFINLYPWITLIGANINVCQGELNGISQSSDSFRDFVEMKEGDKNRMFIVSSRHPKKQSLKCWERTTLLVFDEKWKERPVPLMVEDGNTESFHCGWKALLTDNRSLLLGSFCSASKIKKGLSNKSLIPLPHSGKFSHVPINMLCFLISGFLNELPQ